MPLFDFGKKKEEIIAVFDIGSDSVGGMIIKINSESDPEIIASVRNPVNFLFDINFPAFWRCARNAVKKTASQLLKFSPVPPDRVLCVFSSPWFISQTRIISVRKNEPFEISKDFFEKLLDEEIEIF
ncbi:MAG: hypothetical protein GXP44_03225, partial [bacterium]|nr:hypothetical protein [bacterium]